MNLSETQKNKLADLVPLATSEQRFEFILYAQQRLGIVQSAKQVWDACGDANTERDRLQAIASQAKKLSANLKDMPDADKLIGEVVGWLSSTGASRSDTLIYLIEILDKISKRAILEKKHRHHEWFKQIGSPKKILRFAVGTLANVWEEKIGPIPISSGSDFEIFASRLLCELCIMNLNDYAIKSQLQKRRKLADSSGTFQT